MRIVAAEIPTHRDHIAPALAIACAVALAVAFLVVMAPRDSARVPFLERARTIRIQSAAEGARRRAIAPVVVDDATLVSAPPPAADSGFVCRAPDHASARVWFEERVQPALAPCAAHALAGVTEARVTLAFDSVGLVRDVRLEGAGITTAYAGCAQGALARLAHPDAYELSFTWAFVISR